MATWPNIENPSSLNERTVKAQIKSDFEAGYVQSRTKWTRSRKIFELSWDNMDAADKSTLEDFFENNIGGTFTWTHPLTSTSYTVRFKENELRARHVPVNFWRVDVALEEQ